MKDNLDGFQKLVSTRWTFSISMLIGIDCRDPQPYKFHLIFSLDRIFRSSEKSQKIWSSENETFDQLKKRLLIKWNSA